VVAAIALLGSAFDSDATCLFHETASAQPSHGSGDGVLDQLTIERRGGLTGLPARADTSVSNLSPTDRAAVDTLFKAKGPFAATPGVDRFTYRITRTSAQGAQTIDVPEHLLPPDIAAQVKDQLP
jgi:hypothetical protein